MIPMKYDKPSIICLDKAMITIRGGTTKNVFMVESINSIWQTPAAYEADE
jgi:hypothetical protein